MSKAFRALPPVAPPLASLAAGVQAHDGEVEALEGGLLGREVAAGFHGAPVAGIERLAFVVQMMVRISRSNRRNGTNSAQGVLPEPYDGGVALLSFPGEIGEGVERDGLGRCGVNGLEALGYLGPVPLRCVPGRMPRC
jgi:hypothetical protein